MTPGFKIGYYYLHVNSSIIYESSIVVKNPEEYFDSPFVVKYWPVSTEEEYAQMVIEAKGLDEHIRYGE